MLPTMSHNANTMSSNTKDSSDEPKLMDENISPQDGPFEPTVNSNNNNIISNNNDQVNGEMTSPIGKQRNRICRSFSIGCCNRHNCPYLHISNPQAIIFCHDFQNVGCRRFRCKFLHYSLKEEVHFRKYGKLPNVSSITDRKYNSFQSDRISGRGRTSSAVIHEGTFLRPAQPRAHPISHLTVMHDTTIPNSVYSCTYNTENDDMHDENIHISNQTVFTNRSNDRRDHEIMEERDILYDSPLRRYQNDLDIMVRFRRFEEDQIMLRRRVEANELKIAELRASNEYLLQQNAQLRLTNEQCSRVVNPVTVTTSTQPPVQTAQVITAVSIAPVQVQATPIVSIAGPQTQIIASSGTPLIATNTSTGRIALAQQSMNTLSTTTQPMGPPQRILSTSQITLSPAMAPPSSIGLATINTSQAIAMSNASQPIISYPIMTHSILPH